MARNVQFAMWKHASMLCKQVASVELAPELSQRLGLSCL